MKKEIKLGIFVFLGIIAFMISVMTIKSIRFENGYRLNIYFNEVAGLLEKAWVRVAGVKVGSVEKILLEGKKAKVIVWIKDEVKIHKDAEAKIVSTGLLGVKYLELTLGSDEQPLLKDGDSIVGIDPVSIDKMLSDGLSGLQNLSEALETFTGKGKLAENLNESLRNIREVTHKLNKNLTDEELSDFIDNITDTAKELKKISSILAEVTDEEKIDLKVTLKNLKSISEKLDKVLSDIESGQTTIGKLFSDKEMGEDLKKTVSSLRDASNEAKKTLARFTLFKTYWDYESRYNHEYEEFKSDIGLQIRPKPEKYYFVGVSNASDVDAKSGEKKNTFDLNIGHDIKLKGETFGTVYAGLLRSTGGFGLSVRPFWKWNPWSNFEVYTEAYDFTRTTTKNQKKPKINTGAKIKPVKWLRLSGGIEDITEQSNFHSSVNLVLEDEDIAYLLALIGLARP